MPDSVSKSAGVNSLTVATSTAHPYNESGWTAQGAFLSTGLGTGEALPTLAYSLNEARLKNIVSGFVLSYEARPIGSAVVSSGGWNPNLPESWAKYMPVATPGGSSGGGTGPTCDPSDYYCTGQTKPIK